MERKKLINLSLPRTATQSFDSYASENGLKSLHYSGAERIIYSFERHDFRWRLFKEMVEQNDAISDMPVQLFIPELFSEFSDCSFICVMRSPLSWVSSQRKTYEYVQSSLEVSGKRPFHPDGGGILYSFLRGCQYVDLKTVPDSELESLYYKYHHDLLRLSLELGVTVRWLVLEDPNFDNHIVQIFDDVFALSHKELTLSFPNVDFTR